MTLIADDLALGCRVRGVAASLEPGQVTAICGPNGAGKSSLLELLAGLEVPDAGRVMLDGAPLAAMSPRDRARAIGYLPQTTTIAWDVTVRALVRLGRLPHRDEGEAAVDAALHRLDLLPLADRRAQSLSGGETARVMLARVLAGEPRWLLADEPLAALDLEHRAAVLRHLRGEAARGTGVVAVMHDLAAAMNHADRVLLLDGGRLVADGAPAAVLTPDLIAQVWRVQARWLGEPGARALALG